MLTVRSAVRLFGLALLVVALLPLCAVAQAEPTEKPKLALPLRLEGVSANSGGAWPFWKAGLCTIRVKQWSSAAELAELRSIIEKSGQKGLEKAVKKMPVIANVDGLEIAIATLSPKEDGGSRLLLIMFRRTCHYNLHEEEHLLGAVQIDLDAENKGTGVLAGYTKVQISPDGILNVEAIGGPCVVFKELKVIAGKQ